jgi:hypothetical protein
MDGFQSLLIDVCIDLGRRDIRVSEHFLNDAQVGPIPEQMRRKAVSQKVRVNALFESGPARMLFHDLPDPHRCQFGTALGEKNLAAATALQKFRSFGGQVRCQRFACFATHRHQPRFISLTSYAHDSLFEVEVLKTRVGQFRDTQTACIKQFDYRSIA